jgi:hypothetical protein
MLRFQQTRYTIHQRYWQVLQILVKVQGKDQLVRCHVNNRQCKEIPHPARKRGSMTAQ